MRQVYGHQMTARRIVTGKWITVDDQEIPEEANQSLGDAERSRDSSETAGFWPAVTRAVGDGHELADPDLRLTGGKRALVSSRFSRFGG